MTDNIIFSHNDFDGLLSAAICLDNVENSRVYFSSNMSFKSTFFRIISKLQNFNNIYFFDLSIREEILKVSSVLFKKVVWIDHHINEKIPNFLNSEIVIDSSSKSSTKLVSDYFKYSSEWVEVANEIDSNSCIRKESFIIRDYFSFLKIRYKNLYNRYLSFLARKILKYNPRDFVEREEVKKALSEFEKIKEKFKQIIEENLEMKNIKNLNFAILETKVNIPPYIVFDFAKLKSADVLLIIYRGLRGVKLELRSLTDVDVCKIAKFFNGGGHYKASGAYIPENLTKTQLLSKIEELL